VATVAVLGLTLVVVGSAQMVVGQTQLVVGPAQMPPHRASACAVQCAQNSWQAHVLKL
jgi:hypothetical protein